MQRWLAEIAPRVRPGDADSIVAGLKEKLGLHNVTVQGISPRMHYAQVMVEADYRMKLIGIGIEPPPVKMATYIDRATASDVSKNALQRWYFTPNYDCVRVADDELAMELVGQGPAAQPRGAILAAHIAHSNETYGTVVPYMRMSGIVPPSTARAMKK